MDLKYKLLWVENDKDWAESIQDQIEDIAKRYGFDLEVKLITKEEDIDYNVYDFILMDLNLADMPTGDQLIKKIRNHGVFTTVVFYTAGGADVIKEKIDSMSLEGVFYSDRGAQALVEKVGKVMESSIKKTQDLNYLRGLVMAEVSELDAMMDDIIIKYFSEIDNGLREKFNKNVIIDGREKSLKKQLIPNPDKGCDKDCSLNWVDLAPSKLINTIDSSMKARATNYIVEFVNTQNANIDLKFNYNNYLIEIINVRNNLAHCESQIVDGTEILKTRNGDVSFDNNEFRKIRENIRKYNQLFSILL